MSSHIATLVRKLVQAQCGNVDSETSTQLEQMVLAILSSRISISLSNEFLIIQSLKSSLTSLRDEIVFDRLVSELQCNPVLTRSEITSLLYIILQLQRKSQQHQQPLLRPSQTLPALSSGKVVTTPSKQSINFMAPQNVRQNSFNTGSQAVVNNNLHPKKNTAIPQEELVRDLLFVFQAIDGNYIKYDSKEDRFVLDAKVDVPRSVRIEISKLCELGWLFKKLRDYVNTDMNVGLIEQSFREAVKSELQSYYRILANLEAQFRRVSGTANALTIRGLSVWSQEPLRKLKWLAVMVVPKEATNDKHSTPAPHARLQQLSLLDYHGDPFVTSMSKNLSAYILRPILSMIENWAFRGQLIDPYDEFFVVKNKLVAEKRRISEVGRSVQPDSSYWEWRQQYLLLPERIPPTISPKLANKILVLGKSINFMRQCCGESEWLTEHIGEKITKTLSITNLDGLRAPLNEATAIVNKQLLDLMLNKYNAMVHLQAIQRYMFLGQGDFIDVLMDLLSEELEKPSDQLHKHNLVSILDSAVRSSCMQAFPEYVQECFDVSITNDIQQVSRNRPTGWDMFNLEYRLPSPLNAAFGTDDICMKRLKIFRFLWKIKRVQHILSKTWRGITAASRQLRNVHELRSIMRAAQMLSNEMVHFVYNLQYYIMFEVLEVSWNKFEEGITRARSLDDFIQAHDQYLDRIVAGALLEPQATTDSANASQVSTINTHIMTLLDIIVEFDRVFGNMYALSLEVENRRSSSQVTEYDEDADLEFEQRLKEEVGQPLERIINSYRQTFKRIHKLLERCSLTAAVYTSNKENTTNVSRMIVDDFLPHLLCRLDFNSYYSNKR